MPRCAIFCIAEIPPSILDTLLENTKDHQLALYPHEEFDVGDWFVLMTSKDLSAIHHEISQPVQPFTSPFVGESIEEVTAWFEANISQPQPDLAAYMQRTFIILDTEAVDDEVCTVVCIWDKPVGKMRCVFPLALQNVWVLNMGDPMEEGVMGCYKRSGVVMTEANLKLAQSGGMYLDGMEVKVDETWKDFGNW